MNEKSNKNAKVEQLPAWLITRSADFISCEISGLNRYASNSISETGDGLGGSICPLPNCIRSFLQPLFFSSYKIKDNDDDYIVYFQDKSTYTYRTFCSVKSIPA